MRELICVTLKHFAGIRTLRAATNAQALAKMHRYRIGAVVSNLFRPGGDGIALLEDLRKKHPRVPVIICSGCSDLAYVHLAKRRGAFAFLPKPFRGEDLAKVVAQALISSI